MALGEEGARSYYSILGVDSNASTCAIRNAYRKLAMKWHPDKCSGVERAKSEDAKLKFQEIQEAYTVLSDARKKALYDNGLYDPEDDDEEIEGLTSFISEMADMMAEVKAEGETGNTFQDLQQLFVDMFSTDLNMCGFNNSSTQSTLRHHEKKRSWGGPQSFYEELGSCIIDSQFSSNRAHVFFTDEDDDDYVDSNVTKKRKNAASDLATTCDLAS